MKNIQRIAVLSVPALALVLASSHAHAQQRLKVAVMPATGTNVHQGYLQATSDFVRAHLESTGKYVAGLAPSTGATGEIAPAQAVEVGRQMGADLAVTVHISRLGNTARVRMAAYDTSTGNLVHVDELAAGNPDDLDKVLARLATGLSEGRKAADSADIYTVTEKEADPLLKQTATSTFGVKIGGILPVGAEGGEDAIPGIGVFWLYDVRTFLAEVALDLHNQEDNGDFGVELGAYYPLGKGNSTPYIGGGLQYKFSDYGDNGGGNGIAFHATAGMLFGRLSSVQLRGEVSYFVNTYSENYGLNGEQGKANGLQISVGIGF